MSLPVPVLELTARLGLVARVPFVVAAGIAVGVGGPAVHPALGYLGAGYLAGLLLLSTFKRGHKWERQLLLLADIVAVTLLLSLTRGTPMPLWILYVLPIVSAAGIGALSIPLATALCIAGYLVTSGPREGVAPDLALWPSLLLAAIASAAAALAAERWAEQESTRIWRELTAAAVALNKAHGADEVGTTLVQRVRHLVRAELAALWWHENDGRLRPGPQVGHRSVKLPLVGPLAPALRRKLLGGSVAFAELGEPFVNLQGEVVALTSEEHIVALLVVHWSKPTRWRSALTGRLRLFAPLAASAVTRARAHAAACERERKDGVLQQAASDLAGTIAAPQAEELAVAAARQALLATAALIERQSGRVLCGDHDVADVLVRLTVGAEGESAASTLPGPSAPHGHTPLIAVVDERLALAAWRAAPAWNHDDCAWLPRLADLVRQTFERCAEYRRLHADLEQLQATLDALPAPVAVCDASGATVLTNPAYRALGLHAEDAPDAHLDTPACGGPAIDTATEREIVIGDPPRTFVPATTTSDHRQLSVLLLREVTRERAALRAKDELIAFVGHELRTPLTSIQGYSEIMARHLGVVQQQVHRLSHLLSDLMDVTRLDGQEVSLKRERVQVAELVRAAVDRFRGGHPGRSVELRLHDVAPIEGDPLRLGQIFDNLLGNAAKYSAEGTAITVTAERRDGQVLVAIEDQGVGIDAEHLPHIFEGFYRAPDAGIGQEPGMGIGLAIVRALVLAHRGRVWAESAGRGQGSVFWVSFPPAPPAPSPGS